MWKSLIGLLAWLCLPAVGLPAVAWAAAPAAPAHAPEPAGPLAAKAFFTKPALGVASLSPSGRYLAVTRSTGKDKDATTDVVVYDQQTHEGHSVYAVKGEQLRFDWLKWKADDRLLIGLSRGYAGSIGGFTMVVDFGQFIVAVDRQGGHPVVLMHEDAQAAKQAGTAAALLDPLKADPDHILAIASAPGGVLGVWKADVRTGAAVLIEKGDADTTSWDVDAQANIVVRYRSTGRAFSIDGRGPGESAWNEIVRLKKKDFHELPDFEVFGPAQKPGQLYVLVAPKTAAEGETRTVHIYDFGTRTLGPAVWPALKTEPISVIKRPDNSLMGVCYLADVKMCDFTDKALTASYRGLVKFFDERGNISFVDLSDDGRWVLLDVSGPAEPGAYYLYDLTNKHVDALGSRFPDLPAGRLAKVDPFTYPARDGARIPAYLTHPPGAAKGPLPLVVMPHGGPEERDSLTLDIYAQYLAGRGYLVFQPNFRGSGGYGLSFAEAGHHQWGLRMQDDITDGVKALIASGQVDPARICIVGASYGGYAALFGGAQSPDLYKCVVSVAGVSDLNAFMAWERKESGKADDPRYINWLGLVGDPAVDKARLTQTSPISFAATYGPPVLMFHGDADQNVPVEQSRKMEAALKKAGRKVRLVIYKGEAHSNWDEDNETGTMADIAAFLDEHIGPAAARPAS